MELPRLKPLEFLAIHALFAGPMGTGEVRQALAALGIRRSQTTVWRLLRRMDWYGYVRAKLVVRSGGGGPTVCQHRYTVTDFGVLCWTATQKFYANLAPPSADLAPLATAEGELYAYDPKTRKAIILERTEREFPQLFGRKPRQPGRGAAAQGQDATLTALLAGVQSLKSLQASLIRRKLNS